MSESLGQWRSAPLVYVLAEVRCSPTLDVAKRASAVQEAIRGEFPLLEPVAEVRFGAGIPSGSSTSTMFAFTDSSKKRGVVVTSTSLCYHVTQYVTSAEFFEELGRLLQVLEPIYAADAVTRMGLRYVDAIIPSANMSISDYISPSMVGVSLGGVEQRRVQCVVEEARPNGGIAVRLLALGIPIYLSPDLLALGLRRPSWVDAANERQAPAAILDTDNWVAVERTFEAQEILTTFRGLKEGITNAFLKSITDHSKKEWQLPRE
jgi:uncharacterized protein (TIGR04255 family)